MRDVSVSTGETAASSRRVSNGLPIPPLLEGPPAVAVATAVTQQRQQVEKEFSCMPRLLPTPNEEHVPEHYDDVEHLEYPASMYSLMEQYLPPTMLKAPRDKKLEFLERICAKYRPNGDRTRRHRAYRERIRLTYKPLHEELSSLNPEHFLVQSFRNAVKDGSEEAFRNIMTERSSGLFTFDIFEPRFCSLIMDEVEHFENWAQESKFKVMRPNTMNNYGAVLDDIGMDEMLDQLMRRFISPMSSGITSVESFKIQLECEGTLAPLSKSIQTSWTLGSITFSVLCEISKKHEEMDVPSVKVNQNVRLEPPYCMLFSSLKFGHLSKRILTQIGPPLWLRITKTKAKSVSMSLNEQPSCFTPP